MSNKTWSAWFKLLPISIVIGLVLVWVVFVSARILVVGRNEMATATLQADVQRHIHDSDEERAALRARIDYLESVLFGDVVAKLTAQNAAMKQKPQVTPQWWVNRDRENRQKIQSLEWKVFTLENQLKER